MSKTIDLRSLMVPLFFIALAAICARPAHAADFTVTNVNDSGAGSLRQAILDANNNAGADAIGFDIPGTGVRTIAPASALPTVADPVTIDGTTQPGFSGSPIVELNGAGAGAGVDGLAISAGESTVRGMAINRFSRHGILLQSGGGNTVAGNYIGTDAGGAVSLGNGFSGVRVDASDDNTIGGTPVGAGNVISGNEEGIRLQFTTGSVVRGNHIGTDKSGTADLGNASGGVFLVNASGNTIGGTAAGAGNAIAFNGVGVGVVFGSSNSILFNTIFSNDGLGIDLDDGGGFPLDSVTPNDSGDGDVGANELQNFPKLTSAAYSGGTTTVTGTLKSTANTTFRIQFFSSSGADPSGHGEGKVYLGELTDVLTDGGGSAGFAFSTPNASLGETATATATAMPTGPTPVRSTSEFSKALEVTPPDTAAPTVEGIVTPRKRGANITVRFSESMDPGTLVQNPDAQPSTSETVVLFKGGPTSGIKVPTKVSCTDESCETAIVNPDKRLARRTKYTVRIEGAGDSDGLAVADPAGNELAQDEARTFTTRRK